MRADRMSRAGAGSCRAGRKGKGKPMRNKGRDDIVWNWGRRGAAWLLSLALLCGAVPWQGVTALAAPAPETGMETMALEPEPVDWAQEYLDKLVSWGVMRGDIEGNLHSDADITRAEFVTMVNRAYGYDQAGVNPFTDVDLRSWYADDISIAYNVGYFTGTSSTTAAPETGLTREQGTILLGRNMMLESASGEVLGYSDSREFSDWSRALIGSASEAGIISGYPDGTFRPQANITRGEVAAMLVRALGTPLYEPGNYSLGNVYGNVTIASSGANLRNTVIAGDLYLTGGIGLGELLLENVTVLGRIIASGAGESNKGDSSIILRNVTAEGMVVDSIGNQFVTLRAEGDTQIGTTNVRTPAYLEDVTPDGYGLKLIRLDGEEGTSLQLAGNVKEVINETPNSYLLMAQGSAQRVTIDEKATNATMEISMGARVKELNLDVTTNVGGTGDVAHVNISAPGCSMAMPPDTVDIRPGISARVGNEEMDTVTAAEYSSDPRLLAGYPEARNIAPTTADAVFSTNKRGTIYWAISALADGSVSEEDLITPPVYGGIIMSSGTARADASKTEYSARISGLTSDGSYYLTAVLVDSRGQHSPVKVTAFTTPDDTVPAFTTGYPVMSRVSCDNAQVTVMTNKSCLLYYALLPSGSTAPRPEDFKANAVTGSLSHGSVDVVKNSTTVLSKINGSTILDEKTSYDLYLWLTDYDGVKSSGVQRLTFTTADETPPVVIYMETANITANSVGMSYALDEPGTLYWAVVKKDDQFFRPISGTNYTPVLNDTMRKDADKIQIEAGVGAIRSGSSSAATAGADIRYTISGLEGQTSYDLYYVAKDREGNYSESHMITIRTLDNQAPRFVRYEFDSFNGSTDNPLPLADTSVGLVFSESIQGVNMVGGRRTYQEFEELYNKVLLDDNEVNRDALANELYNHIKMYEVSGGAREEVPRRTWDPKDEEYAEEPWVVDYRYATVTRLVETGEMVITFTKEGLNLDSGATYFFHVDNISDVATPPNQMSNQDLPQFSIVAAQVQLSATDTGKVNVDGKSDPVRIDISFNMKPVTTSRVADSEMWDMILWSDTSINFELYRRKTDGSSDWEQIGSREARLDVPADGSFTAVSLQRAFITPAGNNFQFTQLNALTDGYTYEYGISVTQIGSSRDFETWSDLITMKIGIASGGSRALGNLATSRITQDAWQGALTDITSRVNSVGVWYSGQGSVDELTVRKQFSDSRDPSFDGEYPRFTPTSSTVTMDLMLDRPGTIYYVIAPKLNYFPYVEMDVELKDDNGYLIYDEDGKPLTSREQVRITPDNDHDRQQNPYTYVPEMGGSGPDNQTPNLVVPDYRDILNPKFAASDGAVYGTVRFDGLAVSYKQLGLRPDTGYYAYFVLVGTNVSDNPKVYCYRFTTDPVETPEIALENSSPNVTLGTSVESELNWVLVASTLIGPGHFLRQPFFTETTTGTVTSYGYVDPAQGENFKKTSFYMNNLETVTDDDGNTKTVCNFTVLDALTTVYGRDTQQSVFDVYADTSDAANAIRQRVSEYVRRQNTGNSDRVTENGNLSTAGGNWKEQTLEFVDGAGKTIMTPGVQYYFIAVARHPNGVEYGFKAIEDIHVVDESAPVLEKVTTTIEGVYKIGDTAHADNLVADDVWKTNPVGYMYSGTVTIDFDEEVYILPRGEAVAQEVIVAATTNPKSIINYLGGSARLKITPGVTTTGPTASIVLKFENVVIGENIRLFQSGFISDMYSNTDGQRLQLEFLPTVQSGFIELVRPGFVESWEEG